MEFLTKLKLASNKVSIGESTGNLILPTPEGNDLNLLAVDSEGILNSETIVFSDDVLCSVTAVSADMVGQINFYQTEDESCCTAAIIADSNFSAVQFYCYTNPDNGLSDCTRSTFTLCGEGVVGATETSNDFTQTFCQYQVLLTVKGLEFRSGDRGELYSTLYDLDSIRYNDNYISFPEKEGTIALVEDLPDTSEFVKNGASSLCLSSSLQVGLNSSSSTQIGAGCIDVEYDNKSIFSAFNHGVSFWVLPKYKGTEEVADDTHLTTKKYVDDTINSNINSKLGTVFKYKGNSTYEGLPQKSECSCCTGGPQVGDVYNLTSTSGAYKIGDNVVWDGSAWDKLAATVDLSGYLTTEDADDTYIKLYNSNPQTLVGELYICGGLAVGNAQISTTLEANNAIFLSKVDFECGTSIKFYEGSDVEFCCPVDFKGTVSINELAVQELSMESLSVGEELTIKNVPVLGSIEALQKKTGVFTQILPAKSPINGVTEYQVVFNTDSTKTVVAPPNVVVTDITGSREKYVLVTTEWDENTIYLTFELNEAIKSNTYKVYITNIQLA